MTITRRCFVGSLAAIPAFGLALLAQDRDEVASFRSLSARLTGLPEEDLDRELALGLMEALRSTGDGPGLERLLAGTGADEDTDLARRIVAAWYTGVHPTAGGPTAPAFQDALVWRALDFTKPPGRCTRPGEWSAPPVVAATR
ncbi:MAG: hypothetical protein F4W89_01635 [Acidobacteria bacterium]|nr:hypothetical protein [Acidobacteriota bacterium]